MNRHRLELALIIALAAFILIVSTVGAAPKDGPVISLSTAQNTYRVSEDVLITVTISNPTRHSVRILKWFTPSDGLEEPIFVVKVNGEPVSYSGAIYKRPAPTGSDYITIKSGESISSSVNLGDYYDLSHTGQYKIYYSAASINLFDEKGSGANNIDSLTSESVSLKVEGRAAKGKPTPPPPPPNGGNAFNACSATQQTILINARSQATTYASESKNFLSVNNADTDRYTEWFGKFETAHNNTVASHFASISNAWVTAGVNFDCKCKQNYYAYVYPNRPYNIYLCRVFWLAPPTGTDSQAGTLIHEMSHFYNVAGTDDYVYGQAGARDLAITDPDKAIMNADNHEYFAENNPFLP